MSVRRRLVEVVSSVLIAAPAAAWAVPVDLELVLLADVSGSLDNVDFALQRDGYVSAFNSAGIQSAILGGALGQIAVSLVYWSDSPSIAVNWTLIDSAAAASNFASAIAAAPRSSSGSTGMTRALTFGAGLFANNYEGTRLTIDVSGDGAESNACNFDDETCLPLQAARDSFLAGGANRTINAIWIDDRNFFGDDAADTINALDYGATNVIGGANAFQLIAQDFGDFQQGIASKLTREIVGGDPVPASEPASLALFGLGLAGLALIRRRKRPLVDPSL